MEVLSPNAGFPTEQKNYFFVIIFDVIIIIIAVIITMVEGLRSRGEGGVHR